VVIVTDFFVITLDDTKLVGEETCQQAHNDRLITGSCNIEELINRSNLSVVY